MLMCGDTDRNNYGAVELKGALCIRGVLEVDERCPPAREMHHPQQRLEEHQGKWCETANIWLDLDSNKSFQ